MKLKDLYEQKQKVKGTYAGVKFDTDTNKAVHKYISENKIPNSIRLAQSHSTLLYSRKHLPNYTPAGALTPPWTATPSGFDVFPSAETGTSCLVLKYGCPQLVDRHKSLMDEHGATYDFPSYKPHITLSYDIGDLDISKLPPFDGKLNIIEEYGNDLDLDWAATKGGKGG